MKIADNTLNSVIKYFKDELKTFYGASELEQLMQITLNHYFKISKVDVAIGVEKKFSESDLLKIIYTVKDLKAQKPLAYILGEWEFYDLKIKVNEHTLIPRPETEELVQLIIQENEKQEHINLLDIGTGSGCIALAIKSKLPSANVFAWDISDEALQISEYNAKINSLDIAFNQVDILNYSKLNLREQYEVIVSNPPYISEKEKALMHNNVLDFEPHLALFVKDNEPLLFYKVIAEFAQTHLTKKGSLYFEINENYGDEVKQLLVDKKFKNVNIVKDMNEKDRIVSCNL